MSEEEIPVQGGSEAAKFSVGKFELSPGIDSVPPDVEQALAKSELFKNVELVAQEKRVEGGNWMERTPEEQNQTGVRGSYIISESAPLSSGDRIKQQIKYDVGVDGSVKLSTDTFITDQTGTRPLGLIESRLISELRERRVTSNAQISEAIDPQTGESRPVLTYMETLLRPKA
jgi:hypothetical protein